MMFGSFAILLGQLIVPTFYKDVLPLLQQQCQTCHRPGEVGPMPLIDYAGVKHYASAIAKVVRSRQMPPWFADPSVGHFRNDRSLSPEAARIITSWVEAGAPAGDPKNAPNPVI